MVLSGNRYFQVKIWCSLDIGVSQYGQILDPLSFLQWISHIWSSFLSMMFLPHISNITTGGFSTEKWVLCHSNSSDSGKNCSINHSMAQLFSHVTNLGNFV